MQKLTWTELYEKLLQHNRDNGITSQYGDKNPLIAVVVYKSENWPDCDYSLESRSYEFRSDEKHFVPGMGGNSIFGTSLDGTDVNVRLDWQGWKIDYCYIK